MISQKVQKTEPATFSPRSPSDGDVPCPACGFDQVHYESDYPSNVNPFAACRVHYCTACGVGFVPDARPMLEEYYKRDYALQNRGDRDVAPDVYFSDAYRDGSKGMQRYYARASNQTKLLKRHAARFDHVLDFGSGPGYFLQVSKSRDRHAFEPDEKSTKYLDYLNAKQYDSLGALPRGHFDVILASHSIEHLAAEDLQSTLGVLFECLKPDGRMLIEVPQGGHSYLHLGGVRQDPHTIFFTPQALFEAVRQGGGEILFADALAKVQIPARDPAIYIPDPDDAFFSARRGSLTVVCKRS